MPISALYIISKGLNDYKKSNFIYLKIAFICIFLPQFLHEMYFSSVSINTISSLKQSFINYSSGMGYLEIVSQSLNFLSNYIISLIVVGVIFLIGYFGMIHASAEFHKNNKNIPITKILISGVKLGLPKGIFIAFFIFLITAISNTLFAPMILVTVLASMIPVIYVLEKRKVFSSIHSALFMKYVTSPRSGGPWRSFFTLSGLIGFFYIGIIIIIFMGQMFYSLEAVLPKIISKQEISGFPFSFLFLTNKLATNILNTFLISTLPPITVRFYIEMRQRFTREV